MAETEKLVSLQCGKQERVWSAFTAQPLTMGPKCLATSPPGSFQTQEFKKRCLLWRKLFRDNTVTLEILVLTRAPGCVSGKKCSLLCYPLVLGNTPPCQALRQHRRSAVCRPAGCFCPQSNRHVQQRKGICPLPSWVWMPWPRKIWFCFLWWRRIFEIIF